MGDIEPNIEGDDDIERSAEATNKIECDIVSAHLEVIITHFEINILYSKNKCDMISIAEC